MWCRHVFVRALAFWLAALAARLAAQPDPLSLVSDLGATLTFSSADDRWAWTQLATSADIGDARNVLDESVDLATTDRDELLAGRWELTEKAAGRIVLEQDAPQTGLRVRRVYAFGAASNVVRIETWIRSLGGKKLLTRIGLLDLRIQGEQFRVTGSAPASFPLFGDVLFAGIEHVSGEASTDDVARDRVRLLERPRVNVDEDWKFIATAVVGWPDASRPSGLTGATRVRQSFLQYLDTVRIKPDSILLHTDTWWTVPLPLTEKNVVADIEALQQGLGARTGLFFDTYCVDLGWSDPRTFWSMDARLPNQLHGINSRLAAAGARMGLWMSPGSGYPDALNNGWLKSQGYEMTPFPGKLGEVPCFALGGRYQRDFKDRLVSYVREYGLGHIILDFMNQRCDVPTHGHPVGPESRYAIDAGLADVLDAVRAVNPKIAIEPMVCGYPPSPWWLMKTPFVLGPAGDDLPYGRVPSPQWLESLITARDIAYRAGQEAWIMPTQALETFDIVVLTPGDFENMAVMAVGRGRWFLSTYFKNDLMKPEDWDFLAALVRWARENRSLLGNAWQFGGQAENREAYGFMFRNDAKDLYCARNPWIEARSITLPASASATEPRDVRMIYPRRAWVGRIAPGSQGLGITLPAYETAMFESVPATDPAPDSSFTPNPVAEVAADAPVVASRFAAQPGTNAGEELGGSRFIWSGMITVPDIMESELCILVEGNPAVRTADGRVDLGGRPARVNKITSAGQFAAATDVSPENWTWLIVPLETGTTSFKLDVSTTSDAAAIGVFLRGSVPATNDAAPANGAVFPTYRADRRPWSQTLQPVRALSPGDS